MNRLIKAIREGRFAFERYLSGKTWNGIKLLTEPLFCSYGQIGYSAYVYDNTGRHVLTITHDWEMNTTEYQYV